MGAELNADCGCSATVPFLGTTSCTRTFTFIRTSHSSTHLPAMYVVHALRRSVLTSQKCMLGFNYADEAGAAQLYKKVNNRAKYGMSLAPFAAL